MWQKHDGLSDQINNNIAESELQGGVWLKDLPTGTSLRVTTRKNTRYLLEHREDGWWISGNKHYCPKPTKCYLRGSTWGGGMLKMGFIGRGMFMEFMLEVEGERRVGAVDGHGRILTSQIVEVEEIPHESRRPKDQGR